MVRTVQVSAAAAFFVIAAAAAPAGAQVRPFGPSGFAVPRDDLALLNAAEAKLYDSGAKVGSVERWRNERNGDSGSVTLISTFESDCMPCRRVAHQIKLGGDKRARQFVISRCRTADGSWKILP